MQAPDLGIPDFRPPGPPAPTHANSNLGDYDLPRRLPLSFRDEARTQISKATPDLHESLSK
jgi:hypothetical protein